MGIYIVLFGLALCFGVLYYGETKQIALTKKRSRICYAFIIGTCMIAVEGLRSINIGEDLKGYISWFEIWGKQFDVSMLWDISGLEPGFKLINFLIRKVSDNQQWFIFCTSSLIIVLHLLFLYKNSSDFYISLLLFFGFNFFFTSMVSIRQFIAMGISLWIYPLLMRRKYVKSLVFTIFAFLLHQSSLIGVVGIIGAYILRKRKNAIVFLSVAALISIPFISSIYNYVSSFFDKYSSYYSMTDKSMRIGSLRIVYMIGEAALIVYLLFSKNQNNEESRMISILLLLSIYCGLLSLWMPKIFRIGYYFDYFLLLLIPNCIQKAKRYKQIIGIGTIIVSIIFFTYYLLNNPGETVPYEFFFE